MKIICFISLFTISLLACHAPHKSVTAPALAQPAMAVEGKLFATVFMQRAGEYRALCLQAYNVARTRLDAILGNSSSSRPKAIITDLDETVLDNSKHEVKQDLAGKGFDPVTWNEWTTKGEADTIPGSFSFFKYAASKGVEIYYITNRDEKDRAGTLQNLVRFGFPNSDNSHLLVRQNTSGKEPRRQQVAADHDVVLLLGDNLSDFSDVFDRKPVDERMMAVNQKSGEFGNRFIVLPNPVYGDWESAIYQFKSLSYPQKDSAIKSWLKSE